MNDLQKNRTSNSMGDFAQQSINKYMPWSQYKI